jgi:hypothetical protein
MRFVAARADTDGLWQNPSMKPATKTLLAAGRRGLELLSAPVNEVFSTAASAKDACQSRNPSRSAPAW